MSKSIHNPNSFRKALKHGVQQGFGPFRQRPRKLNSIELPAKSQARGDLQEKAPASAANADGGRVEQPVTGASSTSSLDENGGFVK